MCGIFGLLCEAGLLDGSISMDDALVILERMVAVTEMRGGQSLGIACTAWLGRSDAPFISLKKHVVAKRERPMTAVRKIIDARNASKSPLAQAPVNFLGHSRFATASRNSVRESHPHIWIAPRTEDVWRVVPVEGVGGGDGGPCRYRYERSRATVSIHVAHNGDFEALRIHGASAGVVALGLWLERVLDVPNDTTGDSPKIAGYLELVVVQGRWPAAARLAYQRAVATSMADACGGRAHLTKASQNTAPDSNRCAEWGRFLDELFVRHDACRLPSLPAAEQTAFVQSFKELCVSALASPATRQQLGMASWSDATVSSFVGVAVDAFLHNDLFSGLEAFLSRASGSFAVAASYSLEEGAVVLASRGQPISLALDPRVPLVLYGSESHAVTSAVGTASAGNAEPWALRYKLDLDDFGGEVVRVGKAGLGFGVAAAEAVAVAEAADGTAALANVPALAGNTTGAASAAAANKGQGRPVEILDNFAPGIQLISHCMGLGEAAPEPLPLRERLREHGRVADYRSGGSDLVAEDLKSIPRLVNKINLEWSMRGSANCQAAAEFYRLLSRTAQANRGRFGSIDLLILGIESSLWIGEQFGGDIKKAFKGELNVVVTSANKVLGSSATTAREVHFCGFNRVTREDLRRDHPVVLCISQSGQTFGTLHAVELLLEIVPDTLFALLGDTDTTIERTMARALGRQAVASRIFTNLSGLRPAEAATAATVAMHHTLSHLLLWLVRHSRADDGATGGAGGASGNRARTTTTLDPLEETDASSESSDSEQDNVAREDAGNGDSAAHAGGNGSWRAQSPRAVGSHGVSREVAAAAGAPAESTASITGEGDGPDQLSSSRRGLGLETTLCTGDIQGLQHIVNSLQLHVELACGVDVGGAENGSQLHRRLEQQGQAWARHVTEPWRALVVTGAYVVLTVLFQCPILLAIFRLGLGRTGADVNPIWRGDLYTMRWPSPGEVVASLLVALGFVQRLGDGLIYVFMPKLAAWGMRWWEGRQMGARMGKRTIVIADVPYVHQLLEMFISKSFALSFGFDSIDVHGTSPNDHFVHRFTHRVARGTLIAVGRPDGRICSLLKSEKTVLLALKQAAFIENRGVGPEIMTLGHNPYKGNLPIFSHIPLSSAGRRKFLCEHLYDSVHNRAGEGEREVAELFDVSKHPELEHEFNALLAHKPLGMHHLPDSIGGVLGDGKRQDLHTARAAATAAAAAAAQSDREGTQKAYAGNSSAATELRAADAAHGEASPSSLGAQLALLSTRSLGKLRPEGPTVADDDTVTHDDVAEVSGFSALLSRLRPGGGGASASNSDVGDSPMRSGGRVGGSGGDGRGGGGGGGRGPLMDLSLSGTRRLGSLAAIAAAATSATAHGIMDASASGARALLVALGLRHHRGGPAFEAAEALHHSLDVRQAFQSKLSEEVWEVQDHQILLEHLAESRVLSLERHVAFLVMFHAMADASSRPWIWGRWDVGRSQSTLRVATTASPVCVEPPELPDYEQDKDAIAREAVQWAQSLHREYEGLPMPFGPHRRG